MCIFYNTLSCSVFHFILIRFVKYSLLEAFSCLFFFFQKREGRQENKGRDSQEPFRRDAWHNLISKNGDREGIVETCLGCGVNCDVRTVLLSHGQSKRMFILSLSPPACSSHSLSHSEEAKAWQQVPQSCGLSCCSPVVDVHVDLEGN